MLITSPDSRTFSTHLYNFPPNYFDPLLIPRLQPVAGSDLWIALALLTFPLLAFYKCPCSADWWWFTVSVFMVFSRVKKLHANDMLAGCSEYLPVPLSCVLCIHEKVIRRLWDLLARPRSGPRILKVFPFCSVFNCKVIILYKVPGGDCLLWFGATLYK